MRLPKVGAATLMIGFGVGLVSILFISAVLSYRAATVPKLETCGCGQWLFIPASEVRWPAFILGLGATALLGVGLGSFFRQVKRDRELQRSFQASARLTSILKSHPPFVWVVSGESPFAVTLGFFQPRIYISQALIDLLTPAELEAVVRHEEAHRRRRDPFINVLVSAAGTALGFLPWTRVWVKAAHAEQEMTADREATQALRHVGPIASALVKLNGAPLHVGASWSSLSIRVDQLLNPKPGRIFSLRSVQNSMLGGALVLSLAVIFGTIAIQSVKAKAPIVRRCVETRLWCAERQPLPGSTVYPSFSPPGQMSVYVIP